MPKVSDMLDCTIHAKTFLLCPQSQRETLRLQTLEALVKQKCVYVARASRITIFYSL